MGAYRREFNSTLQGRANQSRRQNWPFGKPTKQAKGSFRLYLDEVSAPSPSSYVAF